jgi:hypothetical protein
MIRWRANRVIGCPEVEPKEVDRPPAGGLFRLVLS